MFLSRAAPAPAVQSKGIIPYAYLLLLAHYIVHVLQLFAVGFRDSGRHASLIFLQSGQERSQQPKEKVHEMNAVDSMRLHGRKLQYVPASSHRNQTKIEPKTTTGPEKVTRERGKVLRTNAIEVNSLLFCRKRVLCACLPCLRQFYPPLLRCSSVAPLIRSGAILFVQALTRSVSDSPDHRPPRGHADYLWSLRVKNYVEILVVQRHGDRSMLLHLAANSAAASFLRFYCARENSPQRVLNFAQSM